VVAHDALELDRLGGGCGRGGGRAGEQSATTAASDIRFMAANLGCRGEANVAEM